MTVANPPSACDRYVVASFGTLGDFLPPFGIARELAAAGHRVDMVGPSYFSAYAQVPGVRFIGYGDARTYARDLADVRGINPDLAWVAEFCGAAALTPQIRAIEAAVAESGTHVAVVAPLHAVGALFAARRHGLRSFGLLTAPNLIDIYSNPRPIAETAYRAAFRGAGMDDPPAPMTDPQRTFLGDYVFEWDHVLELFPRWFDPCPFDRPANSLQGTFPGETAARVVPGLQAFAEAGERPWVFFPGSGGGILKVQPRLFELAAEACRRLGRRGIMLDPRAGDTLEPMGEGIIRAGLTNLNALLPLSRGFFHHGGIGSTSQALAAAVPQVIAPVGFDQPGNANWVASRGLGVQLDSRALTTDALKAALTTAEALDGEACRAFAERLRHEGGARGLAACIVAQTARSSARAPVPA